MTGTSSALSGWGSRL